MMPKLAVVVLLSGNGSNLQAILDVDLPITIQAVVSDQPDAYGLTRAEQAGIPAHVVQELPCEAIDQYDTRLVHLLQGLKPDLIILAGFMRFLGPTLVDMYAGRILNIHPSLLPALRGLNTHQRAIEQGAAWHGATVHFVTAEVDAGPGIIQAWVPVQPTDTPETLAARVLVQEHIIYPIAIGWYATGQVVMRAGRCYRAGAPQRTVIRKPLTFNT